jgi:hypothetical protein
MTDRRTLPHRRHASTFEAVHWPPGGAETRFQVSVGFFLDEAGERPAEVFISGTKAGSSVEAVARDGAVLLSIALQYGVPLDVLRGAITREQDGAPTTIIGTVIDGLEKYQGEQPADRATQPTNTRHERLRRDVRAIVEQELKNAEGT